MLDQFFRLTGQQRLVDRRLPLCHTGIRRHLAATPVLKGIYDFRSTRIAMLQAGTRAELEAILDHIENDILPDQSRRIL